MYRALIIGAGRQAALCDISGTGNEYKIISHAKAFDLHGGFKLVGFYDTNEEACKKAAEIWGCLAFNNLDEAFKAEIDIVSIVTPDKTHYEILKKVAPYQPKLVLCEKPLATTVRDGQKVVKKYKSLGIPLLVNYTRRFIPELQEFKDNVRAGEYGEYLWGWGMFNRGWLHTASHMVDFLLWFNIPGNFQIRQLNRARYRVFQIHLFFEKLYWNMVSGDTVNPMFDKHMFHVVNNIYQHLRNGEELMCTGFDALESLETVISLKGS